MKLIRLGKKGDEKVAALDSNNKYRDLSFYIDDLNPDTINFKLLEELNSVKLENLPEINQSERIGSCISDQVIFWQLVLITKHMLKELNLNYQLNRFSLIKAQDVYRDQ